MAFETVAEIDREIHRAKEVLANAEGENRPRGAASMRRYLTELREERKAMFRRLAARSAC
jgi:hypothetical protein